MDEDPNTPASQGPPPPDIPKPSIPPPVIPPVTAAAPPPVSADVAAPVQIGSKVGEVETGEVLAPFNSRLIAAVIDVLILVGLQIALHVVLPGFMAHVAWVVGLGYLVTRDSLPFLGGQSVGKKAMQLRAVTLDGKALTGNWEPGLIRSGVLLLPFFPLVEIFVLLTREGKPERGRRLGDEWAKTKVIVVPSSVEGSTNSH